MACLVQRRSHGEVRVLDGLVRRMQDAGADGQAAWLGGAVAPGVLQTRRLLILLPKHGYTQLSKATASTMKVES